MPTQPSGSHELAIIPFAPGPYKRSLMVPINSTKRDNLFCSCLIVRHSAAVAAEQNDGRALNIAQRLNVSPARGRKIGSLSWRRSRNLSAKSRASRAMASQGLYGDRRSISAMAQRTPRPELRVDLPIINYWFACWDPLLQDRGRNIRHAIEPSFGRKMGEAIMDFCTPRRSSRITLRPFVYCHSDK